MKQCFFSKAGAKVRLNFGLCKFGSHFSIFFVFLYGWAGFGAADISGKKNGRK